MKLFKPKSNTYAVYYNHDGKSYMQPYTNVDDAREHFRNIDDNDAVLYRISLTILDTKK